MNTEQVYNIFPNKNDCLNFIEKIKWNDTPVCPYCESVKFTKMKVERRYHCSICNTSYSATVGTVFHNSKLDLQKWFISIKILTDNQFDISSRDLASRVRINKDTACRIKQVLIEGSYNQKQRRIIQAINQHLNQNYNE